MVQLQQPGGQTENHLQKLQLISDLRSAYITVPFSQMYRTEKNYQDGDMGSWVGR